MRCPSCGERDTRVVDSRDIDDAAIRRRRECNLCATRFTTYERIEAARLTVVKSDGRRVEFDREKLASGLAKALTRRPVADDAADRAAEEIETALRARGSSEVPSELIGTLAMEKLRELDQIAYIRFASVYQSFEDIEQLRREVDALLAEREELEADEDGRQPGGGGSAGGKRYPKR
jgi:transcriptional repressor NrdR